MKKSALILWLLCPLAALAQSPPAQQEEPAYLSQLRSSYEERAKQKVAGLNSNYAKHLLALELRLAAAGDYEQARSVKSERESLAAPTTPAALPVAQDAITLLPSAARTIGLSLKDAGLTSWRSSSTADWILARMPTGSYRVEVEAMPVVVDTGLPIPADEREFTADLFVKENSSLTGAAGNLVSGELMLSALPSTVQPASTVEMKGTLTVSRLPFSLRMSISGLTSKVNLSVTKVRLVPLAAAASTSLASTAPTPQPLAAESTASTFATQIAALKAEQEKRLQAARADLVSDYLSDLNEMTAALPSPDLREEVEDEIARVNRSLKDGPRKPKGRPGLDVVALGVEGFTELEGAHYLPDPANRGDRFIIEHEGKKIFVRLAFVTTPPMEERDGLSMKSVTKGFGISDADALALGAAAKEFTELQLQGESLTVLLRGRIPAPGSSDFVYALVFGAEMGLLQNQLIDAGLAVVEPWRGKHRPPLHRAMEEREAAARSSSTPTGAWSLSRSAKP